MWTYRCYVTCDEPNLWSAWYVQHPDAQGSHDAAFEILESQESWAGLGGFVKPLQGNDKHGVLEVKFKAKNIQWRVFGCYGTERREFIVLAVGYHKGKTYDPKNVMNTAAKRMKEVKGDATKAKRCDRPGTA